MTASKTVAVPVERLYAAFTDVDLRERWLPGAVMHERTSRPGRSVRFDRDDAATRVNVAFSAAGEHRAQVVVEHEWLAHSQAAARVKDRWSQRLTAL